MDYKYTGIILNKKDVGETDRLYTVYTLESGKIRALAKGVRKSSAKLAGNLENFTLADLVVVRNQGTGKITASIVEQNFSGLKKDFEALARAFDSVKLLNGMVHWEEKDEKLFELLEEYMETLDASSGKGESCLETVALGFGFKMLEALGYGLEMGRCVACGNALPLEGDFFFSPQRGGVICSDCRKASDRSVRISHNAVKAIRIFFQNRIRSLVKLKIDPKDLRELRIIQRNFMAWVGK